VAVPKSRRRSWSIASVALLVFMGSPRFNWLFSAALACCLTPTAAARETPVIVSRSAADQPNVNAKASTPERKKSIFELAIGDGFRLPD
ncbi:MAG: hypothetical protein ACXW3M_13555, partial [Rhodoplanes sp.]